MGEFKAELQLVEKITVEALVDDAGDFTHVLVKWGGWSNLRDPLGQRPPYGKVYTVEQWKQLWTGGLVPVWAPGFMPDPPREAKNPTDD